MPNPQTIFVLIMFTCIVIVLVFTLVAPRVFSQEAEPPLPASKPEDFGV